jgi:DNA-binding NarL/FixJ family response regulator
LLADDHEAFLSSVREMLSGEYDIVGSVRDGAALVTAARADMPDLIVSDLSMPVKSGFQAAAMLLEDKHPVPVIFLTVESSPSYVRKALSVGARGYVLKTYASEQLQLAVNEVLAGRQFISPQISLKVSA